MNLLISFKRFNLNFVVSYVTSSNVAMIFDNGFVLFAVIETLQNIFCKLHFIGSISFTKFSSCLTLSLIIYFETVLLPTVSDCTKSFYVHWNTTNPIFRPENSDHIISVNQGNTQFEYDQVNIICPVYTPGTHEDDAEKYIIYNVSKDEYESCRITNASPRIIAVCDKPNKLLYYTITFRPFTPQPGGLEFPPGQDYYFISTSSKDDLHRRIGGRCASNNMKIIFKVCCNSGDNYKSSNRHKNISSNSDISTTESPVYSYTSIVKVPAVSTHTTTVEPLLHFNKPATKKVHEFQYHPNEIIKNEELSHSNSVHWWYDCKYTLAFTLILNLVLLINR